MLVKKFALTSRLSYVIALFLSFALMFGITGSIMISASAEPNKTSSGMVESDTVQRKITESKNITENFSAMGSISSLIYQTRVNNTSVLAAAEKSIVSGAWFIQNTGGIITAFVAKFNQVLDDGTRWHTYELFNFTTAKHGNDPRVHLTSDDSAIFSGTVDIKLNNTVVWKNIKLTVFLLKGNTIIFALDDKAIGDHFRDQPIYGTVVSIKDRMGREMKIG
jgi:hypothetical protein